MNRALVAEDNAALGRVIALTLRKAGFEVSQAPDGAAAWALAQQTEFDLVVTDQQMPEMSGLELCKRLREQAAHRDTPIVLLTAKGMELDLHRTRQDYGVSNMLLKPFSPTELAKTARGLVAEVV